MTAPNVNSSPCEETDADRRRDILGDNALSLDLVSALAGDRPLAEAEKNRVDDLKKRRGLRFFSDLLCSITHEHFPPEVVAADGQGESDVNGTGRPNH